MRSSNLIFIAAALAGCATTTQLMENVGAKPSCCKSMAEFQYERLSKGAALPFTLDSQSPVFAFETGKSYFKALAIEAGPETPTLRVKSTPTGSIAFESEKYSQAYCPRVIFLDVNHQQISANEGVPTWESGLWSSAFVIDFAIPKGSKYVVLLSNPDLYSKFAYRYLGGGGYMVGSVYIAPSSYKLEAVSHPCGPVASASAELI